MYFIILKDKSIIQKNCIFITCMIRNNNRYNKKLIFSWFMTLLLFLGIGGYSNYTQPISFQENVELVVSDKQNSAKVLSFRNTLDQEQYYLYSNKLNLLVKHHEAITAIACKKFNNTISLEINHLLSFFFHHKYSSEEEILFV
ncbi:hypothetical protein [Aquimarina litoralis]|uniref:hypothetical protein n=1 Tax=Aquimarina litoralis TaxID=584605 RepID=UPI001C5A1C2E|nr:hypothetical protein [Aquimarina litoralis]MBW1298628.1 hypothetical protein [Aquimarina litoralis]